jgi:hypothetical protein
VLLTSSLMSAGAATWVAITNTSLHAPAVKGGWFIRISAYYAFNI